MLGAVPVTRGVGSRSCEHRGRAAGDEKDGSVYWCGRRVLGEVSAVAGSVLRPAPEMLGDIPVFPLEDLDPCDFDIVLVVDACLDEADLPSKSDWTKEAGSQGMGPSVPRLAEVQAAEKINEQVDEPPARMWCRVTDRWPRAGKKDGEGERAMRGYAVEVSSGGACGQVSYVGVAGADAADDSMEMACPMDDKRIDALAFSSWDLRDLSAKKEFDLRFAKGKGTKNRWGPKCSSYPDFAEAAGIKNCEENRRDFQVLFYDFEFAATHATHISMLGAVVLDSFLKVQEAYSAKILSADLGDGAALNFAPRQAGAAGAVQFWTSASNQGFVKTTGARDGLLTLFFAKICDALDGQDAAGDIGSFLFDHVEDSCDTPLGFLVALFWVVLFFKMILGHTCGEVGPYLSSRDIMLEVKCFFYYCLVIPTVLFEFTWPTATFVSLVLARDCSGKLQASAWLVLSPYLLKAFAMTMIILWRPCLKPIFYRTGLMTDPANLVNNFTRLTYSAEAFNDDGGYATSCAICLADFEEQDHIVLAPCATAKHVFHRSCLASWFQTAQTCPLCRSHLHSQTATLPSSSHLGEIGRCDQAEVTIPWLAISRFIQHILCFDRFCACRMFFFHHQCSEIF
ncbi:E3 ubiquitin-protein ligase ATL31 (Protein CARBON/NITROGEN INSENSITIVE 1) (Protein SUPER SURVIVAL 1) (RING-H2 finger protein ATL31) (RING-type E3 ubiquitin transferase ATL31) [Durusdinium trenchii]|uniref:E3 ubiquitin-protein ligase ATL31 (Protein CARBON/NITROGEN INSENSITIVE 1) (Protein SUPER SURVIVAL 1) (RING-H2 finger protein ATL31) (RING-type E3 ubiquitin transferase ATL31) n=1 Tax=Durusdinium trenchii TaxID=1381693 RepID=A0ABP0LU64_9DINO